MIESSSRDLSSEAQTLSVVHLDESQRDAFFKSLHEKSSFRNVFAPEKLAEWFVFNPRSENEIKNIVLTISKNAHFSQTNSLRSIVLFAPDRRTIIRLLWPASLGTHAQICRAMKATLPHVSHITYASGLFMPETGKGKMYEPQEIRKIYDWFFYTLEPDVNEP